MRRILIVEPYFGGSHKHFLDGLQQNIDADYTLISLPARKWKRRMQLSAPWFVAKIEEFTVRSRDFDLVLCSTFVDVAMLKALLINVEGWNAGAQFYTYFHENQFVYPQQVDNKSIYQFTAINFNSALVSDKIGFNSDFNRQSFLQHCRKYVKNVADMKLSWTIDAIEEKSEVLFPGIDFTEIDRFEKTIDSNVPVIVWNHRWEHDKNPAEFFSGLAELEDGGFDFKLILLGQSFRSNPQCFTEALVRFDKKIVHSGFVESYAEYAGLLRQGDIVVSTSLHEFYGISVIEALRAGCLPLLPARLSYPELFGHNFLYQEGQFVQSLKKAIMHKQRIDPGEAKKHTERFSWKKLKEQYEKWFLIHG